MAFVTRILSVGATPLIGAGLSAPTAQAAFAVTRHHRAQGYVSGSPLKDTMTFDNATFSSLTVTPGVYVWNWGAG